MNSQRSPIIVIDLSWCCRFIIFSFSPSTFPSNTIDTQIFRNALYDALHYLYRAYYYLLYQVRGSKLKRATILKAISNCWIHPRTPTDDVQCCVACWICVPVFIGITLITLQVMIPLLVWVARMIRRNAHSGQTVSIPERLQRVTIVFHLQWHQRSSVALRLLHQTRPILWGSHYQRLTWLIVGVA
jgi:hypothetical protein